jgi:DnaK suppressor protein
VTVDQDPESRQRREVLARSADERRRTIDRLASLTRDFDDIVERSSDASRDDEHDPEGATIAFERAPPHTCVRCAT